MLFPGKLSSPVPALSDFDPTLLQPSWIAQESWELILAISSLKGPLDSICTHIASNPGPWRDWYESERPEVQPLPIEIEDAEDAPTLTALDRLLMILCLRSDRFEQAMRILVENEVGDLVEKSLPHFDEILSRIKHSIPIFVVMPDHTCMNTPFKISPVESIRRIAEVRQTELYHSVYFPTMCSVRQYVQCYLKTVEVCKNFHLAELYADCCIFLL